MCAITIALAFNYWNYKQFNFYILHKKDENWANFMIV